MTNLNIEATNSVYTALLSWVEKSRGGIKLPGQSCEIRPINTGTKEELARLKSLENNQERVRWFESRPEDFIPLGDEEIERLARNEAGCLILAIIGADLVGSSEKGKLQGFVKVNIDEPYRVEQIKNAQLVDIDGDGKPDLLEISYAKLPIAHSGQVASAVRQVCWEIGNHVSKTAMTAYVMPGNDKSFRVLESAGFEQKGRIQYDPKASDKDHFFVLSWAKLAEKLQASSPIV